MPPAASPFSLPDLDTFRVVPPVKADIRESRLPDGTPMIGADGFLVRWDYV